MAIRHIVLLTLVELDPDEHSAATGALVAALRELPPLIPEIESMTVQPNCIDAAGNADVVAVIDLADEAAVDTYLQHPAHLAAIARNRHLIGGRAAIDITR